MPSPQHEQPARTRLRPGPRTFIVTQNGEGLSEVKMTSGFGYLLLCLTLSGIGCVRQLTAVEQATSAATTEPRFTPPPGEETPEIKTLIDKAQAALVSGKLKATDLLVDPHSELPAHIHVEIEAQGSERQ